MSNPNGFGMRDFGSTATDWITQCVQRKDLDAQ